MEWLLLSSISLGLQTWEQASCQARFDYYEHLAHHHGPLEVPCTGAPTIYLCGLDSLLIPKSALGALQRSSPVGGCEPGTEDGAKRDFHFLFGTSGYPP